MKKDAIEKTSTETESLPALIGKMADDFMGLLDAKLALLKIEVREDVAAYVRSSVMIIIGGVTALVGFALVNVAIAFLISRLFQNTSLSQPVRYGLGFAITGLIYLVVGTVLIIINKNKLAVQDMMPTRSINELKKDRAKIESGLE